jgi:hypothetical protein
LAQQLSSSIYRAAKRTILAARIAGAGSGLAKHVWGLEELLRA